MSSRPPIQSRPQPMRRPRPRSPSPEPHKAWPRRRKDFRGSSGPLSSTIGAASSPKSSSFRFREGGRSAIPDRALPSALLFWRRIPFILKFRGRLKEHPLRFRSFRDPDVSRETSGDEILDSMRLSLLSQIRTTPDYFGPPRRHRPPASPHEGESSGTKETERPSLRAADGPTFRLGDISFYPILYPWLLSQMKAAWNEQVSVSQGPFTKS